MQAIAIAIALCGCSDGPEASEAPARRSLLSVQEAAGAMQSAVATSSHLTGLELLPGWRERIRDEPEPRPFGTAGTKRIQYSGGFGFEVNDTDPFIQAGVSWSYFFADNLSLDLELNGLYFNQDVGDDALGVNANLILRWHFYTRDSWSIYGDGGAGLMATTAHVPAVGSSLSFTPQIGGGFSFDLDDSRRLLAGVRWHHVSNGETFDDNNGRDSVYFYAMLSLPY